MERYLRAGAVHRDWGPHGRGGEGFAAIIDIIIAVDTAAAVSILVGLLGVVLGVVFGRVFRRSYLDKQWDWFRFLESAY